MLDTLFTSHTNIHKETLRSINAFIIKARDNPNSMSLTQTQSNFFHKRKQYRLRPSKRKPTKAESSYPLKSANEGLNIISGRIKALEKVLEKFPKDSNQYSALLAFKEEYHAHNNELKALIERQYAKQAEDKDGCSLPRLPALSSRERKTKGENNTTADTFVSLPKL